jgi:hypothetical protein
MKMKKVWALANLSSSICVPAKYMSRYLQGTLPVYC